MGGLTGVLWVGGDGASGGSLVGQMIGSKMSAKKLIMVLSILAILCVIGLIVTIKVYDGNRSLPLKQTRAT